MPADFRSDYNRFRVEGFCDIVRRYWQFDSYPSIAGTLGREGSWDLLVPFGTRTKLQVHIREKSVVDARDSTRKWLAELILQKSDEGNQGRGYREYTYRLFDWVTGRGSETSAASGHHVGEESNYSNEPGKANFSIICYIIYCTARLTTGSTSFVQFAKFAKTSEEYFLYHLFYNRLRNVY